MSILIIAFLFITPVSIPDDQMWSKEELAMANTAKDAKYLTEEEKEDDNAGKPCQNGW